MGPAEESGSIQLELVWSPKAGDMRHLHVRARAGDTIEAVLRACPDFADQCSHLAELKIGVWGRLKPLDTPLRDRDRIEVYRPLTVDPKEARRQRYKARGQRIISRHRPLAGKTGP